MALSSQNKRQVFDLIRKKWIRASPEEIVRQACVKRLIEALGFPKELVSLEKEIKEIPQVRLSALELPNRRIDIACFAKGNALEQPLFPLMIIECKESKIDHRAIDQVIGYNFFVQAPFIGLVSPYEEVMGHWDSIAQKYLFQRGFLSYAKLLASLDLLRN